MSSRVVSLSERFACAERDDPKRSAMPFEFCERVARNARAEVERIESSREHQIRHALKLADLLAEEILRTL